MVLLVWTMWSHCLNSFEKTIVSNFFKVYDPWNTVIVLVTVLLLPKVSQLLTDCAFIGVDAVGANCAGFSSAGPAAGVRGQGFIPECSDRTGCAEFDAVQYIPLLPIRTHDWNRIKIRSNQIWTYFGIYSPDSILPLLNLLRRRRST